MTTHPKNFLVEPGIDQVKHRIRDIGIIEARDGELFVNHWHFLHAVDWVPEGTQIREELIDGRIAGWTLWELHDIAHGYPCGCGVEKILRDQGVAPDHFRGPTR